MFQIHPRTSIYPSHLSLPVKLPTSQPTRNPALPTRLLHRCNPHIYCNQSVSHVLYFHLLLCVSPSHRIATINATPAQSKTHLGKQPRVCTTSKFAMREVCCPINKRIVFLLTLITISFRNYETDPSEQSMLFPLRCLYLSTPGCCSSSCLRSSIFKSHHPAVASHSYGDPSARLFHSC